MAEFTALVRAPSNIALIKYMGKADSIKNLPANPSLSMTLDRLATWVRVEASGSVPSLKLKELVAGSVPGVEFFAGAVSEKATSRVLAFFDRAVPLLKKALEESGIGFQAAGLTCSTANTFPTGAGVASSASSFAALTFAWALGFSADRSRFRWEFEAGGDLRLKLAQISRLGSGSSCRSFQGPWVEWSGENIQAVSSRLEPICDLVLLIESSPKAVSSSEAHLRVQTSDLYPARASRVEQRLIQLKKSLAEGDFPIVREIGWAEAMEMHALFHTAHPPFSYWAPGTVEMLQILMSGDDKLSDDLNRLGLEAPLVTLDAGANIHLLVPEKSVAKWKTALAARFPSLRVLEDRQGTGPGVVEMTEGVR